MLEVVTTVEMEIPSAPCFKLGSRSYRLTHGLWRNKVQRVDVAEVNDKWQITAVLRPVQVIYQGEPHAAIPYSSFRMAGISHSPKH